MLQARTSRRRSPVSIPPSKSASAACHRSCPLSRSWTLSPPPNPHCPNYRRPPSPATGGPRRRGTEQVAQPIVLAGKLGILGTRRVAFSPSLRQHRVQRRNVIGESLGGRVHDSIESRGRRRGAPRKGGESI